MASCSRGMVNPIMKNHLKYKRKYMKLKKTIKNLVFENAAICDEVAIVETQILSAEKDRSYLLKKLLEHEHKTVLSDPAETCLKLRLPQTGNKEHKMLIKLLERDKKTVPTMPTEVILKVPLPPPGKKEERQILLNKLMEYAKKEIGTDCVFKVPLPPADNKSKRRSNFEDINFCM